MPPPPTFIVLGAEPPTFHQACIFTHGINPIAGAQDLFTTAHGQICPLILFTAATPLFMWVFKPVGFRKKRLPEKGIGMDYGNLFYMQSSF